MGSDIGASRAKLEARYLRQGADDEGEVLSGATTADQLLSNLAAPGLDCGDELDHGLATLSEEPAEYWSARAALAWN
jgi:aryl-alcohol dehydrogenase-like predicted oxidoreductase